MNLGMIGTRGHYGYVLEGLRDLPQVRIAGVCPGHDGEDISPLTKAAAERGDTPAVFTDYRAMLDTVKPDILTVCGPFEEHAPMALAGLERRIAVFCEKPVALTLDDLSRLKAAQAASGAHFAAMMGLRYEPALLTAWRLVRDGAIGAVRMVTAQKSYKLGSRPDYYRTRATYGGTIPWVGSHAIDWIYWFSGETFRTVTAAHSIRDNHGLGDCEMTAVLQFGMSNDVLATANLDLLRPASATTHGDDRVRVAGTGGMVEVRGQTVYLANGDGERIVDAVAGPTIFGDFVARVAGADAALLEPSDVWAVTEACLLARQAADDGRPMGFTCL